VIEAELKARVHNPERVRPQLERLAGGRDSSYHGIYHDWPDGSLIRDGRELRVRVVRYRHRSPESLKRWSLRRPP
jgi:adenylate cyclase, class 2